MVLEEQISLAKNYEIRHWMRSLCCTQAQLYAAVAAVGKRPDDVRAYLDAHVAKSDRWRLPCAACATDDPGDFPPFGP